MLRKLMSLVLLSVTLCSSGLNPALAQGQDGGVERFLKPGEHAHRLKAVEMQGQIYELYYLSTNSQQAYTGGELFVNWFPDAADRWESQLSLTGLLVLANGLPVRDEATLFQVFMLSAAEVYMSRMQTDESASLPREAVETIDSFFTDDYLRWAVFWEQELFGQIFQSEEDTYAEALRLMLSSDSPEGDDAQQMNQALQQFADGVVSAEEVVESAARFSRYNNNQLIRIQFRSRLEELLTRWNIWKIDQIGGYDLDIGGIHVEGALALDLLQYGARLVQLQAAAAERVDMLRVIRDHLTSSDRAVEADPMLLAAMDQVIQEAEEPLESVATLIEEFVKEKAYAGLLNFTRDRLAAEWAHWAFRRFGTRVVGHYVASAVSSVFLGYAISNIAFGLDSVHANTYNARYCQLSHSLFGQLAHAIRTSAVSSNPYVESDRVALYRASYVFSKLAEIEFYKALAERSEAVWSLKIIIDIFSGGSMSQGIEDTRDYARSVGRFLFPYWVSPPLIQRAVELAVERSQPVGPVDTSTVLVMDLSGSMDDLDPSGMTKIKAAVQAAEQLTFQLGSDNDWLGMHHEVALVAFNNDAGVISSFTSDPTTLAPTLGVLTASGGTNLSAGFDLANQLLASESEGASRFVILMTDGKPNEGLETLEAFLAGPVAQAEAMGACVMTVGFGDDVNEALLRGIADGSSCGQYYQARDAFELRVAYAQTAAETGGEKVTLLRGTVTQNETVVAGTYEVPPRQDAAAFHLLWPGSELGLSLKDPAGREVQPDGQRIRVESQTPNATRLLVQQPSAGVWTVVVQGIQVNEPAGEPYSVVIYTVAAPAGATTALGPIAVVLMIAAAGLGTYAASRSVRARLRITETRPAGAELVALAGPRVGTRIPLHQTALTIGRARASAVNLADRGVSRQHAVIYFQDRWFIRDQGSQHGTFLNGRPIEVAALKQGDRITIGGSEFEFRIL